MTEITARKGSPFFPRPAPPRYVIDPVAFFLALIGAPLAVTALSFWLFLVPVGALVLGGPVYLALGTPILLWYLGRYPPEKGRIAWLAVRVNLLATLLIYLSLVTFSDARSPEGTLLLYGGFGTVFAALWGEMFAYLYREFRSGLYMPPAQPHLTHPELQED